MINVRTTTLVTARIFRIAFFAEEKKRAHQLSANLATSLVQGYKGFRAVGRTTQKRTILYTLESCFEVCRLMGAQFFEDEVIPNIERHIVPKPLVTREEFLAILWIHGNNIEGLCEGGKDSKKLHGKMQSIAPEHHVNGKKVFRYMDLAKAAEKCGLLVPPLEEAPSSNKLLDLPQNDDSEKLPELPVTQDEIDSEFEGVESARCLRYIASACTVIESQLDYVSDNGDCLLACVRENNRLLRELLKVWKGDQP